MADQETAYTQSVQRPDPTVVETTRLPLRRVAWDVYCRPDEIGAGKQWPPQRFADRDRRLQVLDQIYDTDLSPLYDLDDVDGADAARLGRVSGDPYRAHVETVVDTICAVPPRVLPEGTVDQAALEDAVWAAATDILKYSGCWLISSWHDGQLTLSQANPRTIYPTADGGYVAVQPYVSDQAADTAADRVRVFSAGPDGATTLTVHQWSAGSIGIVEDGPDEWGAGSWATPIPGLARWGPSYIERMAKTATELAVRAAQSSHVLNANADPTLIAEIDRSDLAALARQPELGFGRQRRSRAAQEPLDTQVGHAAQVAREIRRSDVNVAPGTNITWKYLGYDGELEPGLAYQMMLERTLSRDTGIPSWLLSSEGFPASGVALGRILHRLSSMCRRLHERLRVGVAAAIAAAVDETGDQPTVEWPFYFDLQDDGFGVPSARTAQSADQPDTDSDLDTGQQ